MAAVQSSTPGSAPAQLPLPTGEASKATTTAQRALNAPQSAPANPTYSVVSLDDEIEQALLLAQNPDTKEAGKCQLLKCYAQLDIPKTAQESLARAKCKRGLIFFVDTSDKWQAIMKTHLDLAIAYNLLPPVGKLVMLEKIKLEYTKLWEIAQSLEGNFKDIEAALEKHTEEVASLSTGGPKQEEKSWIRTALYVTFSLGLAIAAVKLAMYFLQSRNNGKA